MTSSKPGTFKPGDDPRRNKAGNLNKEAQAWEIKFRNHLARKLKPEHAAEILIKFYDRGYSWAVEEVNTRLMGKVSQPVSGGVTMDGKLIVEFVETKG